MTANYLGAYLLLLAFSHLRYSAAQNNVIYVSTADSTLQVSEGEDAIVCVTATSSVGFSEGDLVITNNFIHFITADSNDITFALPSMFMLTANDSTECVNIPILQDNIFEGQEMFEFQFDLSRESSSNHAVIVTQQNKTLVIINGLTPVVFVPPLVNVSEGVPAVICFNLTSSPLQHAPNILLGLSTRDNTTSSDDYDHESIPDSVTLSSVEPFQCIRIPTFRNDDGRNNVESFVITISSSPPVNVQSRVEVRLFEQCVNGDVKLVNGSSDVEGRVEVCSNGSFGTICDFTPWTVDDASAVCQQLGLVVQEGMSVPSDTTTFGVGSGPYLPGSFICPSGESKFLNCFHPQTMPQVCLPNAGVFCRNDRVVCSQGSVRLVGSEIGLEGRVEYCNANQWGTVCNEGWDSMDAAVVCRQLDVTSGFPPVTASASRYGAGSGPIWLAGLQCTGQENNLSSCSTSPSIPETCTHQQDAAVICDPMGCNDGHYTCNSEKKCLNLSVRCDGFPDCMVNSIFGVFANDEVRCQPPECSNGDIRPLIGGVSPKEGLVEVCVGGAFYRVSFLSIAEASVICRQLKQGTAGFPILASDVLPVEALMPHRFLSVPIIAEIKCNGKEQSLSECDLLTDESENNAVNFFQAIKCIEAADCTDNSTRLVPASLPTDGTHPREGRLEICYLGVWGAVYDSNWTYIDAAVTCNDFGFSPKGAVPLLSVVHESDPRFLPISHYKPQCHSIVNGSVLNCLNETPLPTDEIAHPQAKRSITQSMSRLSRIGLRKEKLNRSRRQSIDEEISIDDLVGTGALKYVVGVRCEAFQTTGCEDSSIRLAFRGRSESTGHLEVCMGGVWQSLCFESLNQNAVNVACRQLGFTDYEGTGAQHEKKKSDQLVPGMAFYPDFNCSGSESSLVDCVPTRAKRNVTGCDTPYVELNCLARPLIFLDPPIPSGVLTLEENRQTNFTCAVDQSDFPRVTSLSSGTSVSSSGSVTLLNTPAMLSDTGTYECTASSNGVNTTRTIEVVVKGMESGGSTSLNFMRFSLPSSLKNSNRESDSPIATFDTEDLEALVLKSIIIDIPGQQTVACKTVIRTEEDDTHRLDRYECIITTFGGLISSTGTLVAQSSATAMQLQFPTVFVLYNFSSSGFCNTDKVLYHRDINYTWPETEVGNIATLPCTFSSDVATRQCGSNGVWEPPNTSLCENASTIINEVLNGNVTFETLEEQLHRVAFALNLTVDDGSQQTTLLLRNVSIYLTSVSALITKNSTTTTISNTVVNRLVVSVSSLQQWPAHLFAGNDNSSVIIQSFDSIIAQYAQNLNVNEPIIVIKADFELRAESVPLKTLQLSGHSVDFNDKATESNLEASILLPQSLFDNITDRTNVGLFFARYNKSTLFPIRNTTNSAGMDHVRTTVVGSSVIAATVGPGLPFNNLHPPVLIILGIRPANDSLIINGSQVCVSWDFKAAGNLGNWTTDGCTAVNITDDVVTCQCTHLTNFAVLIDICTRVGDGSGCKTNEALDTALSYITYIGVALSLSGLVITVITLLKFKKMRSLDATKYHIQLAIAIFLMLVAFVAGVERTTVLEGCIAASVLIHYFTLASVMWMLAEALLMFQKLVFVFKKVTKRGIITTSLFCWLTPIIPVVIPLIIDLVNGSEVSDDLIINRQQYCFLSNPYVFWFAFLAPVFAILIFNSAILIIVVVVLVKHTRGTLARKKESMKTKQAVILLMSVTGIMFLFGNTWLFAALTFTVEQVRSPAQVLFTVFNSFQGFFIFVFFCVLSKEARESWKEVLSCGRYKSTYLHPTMKWSKSSVGTHRGTSKSRLIKHGSSSDFNTKNSVTTGIFSSNGRSSLGVGIDPTSSSKENIYPNPTYPEEKKEGDSSSSLSGAEDERSDSNIYSGRDDPGREAKENGGNVSSEPADSGRERRKNELRDKKNESSGPSTNSTAYPDGAVVTNESLSSTLASKKDLLNSGPEICGMDNLSAVKKTVASVSQLMAELLSGSKTDGVDSKRKIIMETNIDEEEDNVSIEMGEICIEFVDDH